MSERILNQRQASALAALVDAVQRDARVARLNTETDHVVYGKLRHFVRETEHAYFLQDEDDIRDAYVRVTDTLGIEHFWPVEDLLQAYTLDTLAFDYDPPKGA